MRARCRSTVLTRIRYSYVSAFAIQKAPVTSVNRAFWSVASAPPPYWFFQWLVTLYRPPSRHIVVAFSTQEPVPPDPIDCPAASALMNP